MPRRQRYRLLAAVAVFLVFILCNVNYNSRIGQSRPYLVKEQTAVHPDLDIAAPQEPTDKDDVESTVETGLREHNAAAKMPPFRPDKSNDRPEQSLSSKPPTSTADPPISTTDPSSSDTRLHWTSSTEKYPVPTQSIAPLPTGKPKPIPKIQFNFQPESAEAKKKRQDRQQKVKAAISKSWASYRKYAWMHDELKPVSAGFRDPFCGWAATLVDALDTLWIAGFKDEFHDAVVNGVAKIDFTYSQKAKLPVFETTIRYLGGLVAAYDVSGGHQGQYRILLDKAVELGEILFGIFDTPNRMPILYYNWLPDKGSKPDEANIVGIAELATLSMEFTRLAQLTGEDRYYDAINRITDALVRFQKDGHSAIPGLFPEKVDATGCDATAARHDHSAQDQDSREECIDRGLIPASSYHTYSMGGSQDSAYEYFAKQYLLLGGLEPKYQKLHQDTVAAINESLLYRPMINSSEWDIYFTAKLTTVQREAKQNKIMEFESTHLTCFIGGMYGIGSKIFGRKQDLETAKRLTDGCVWAYQSTPTGLMPEGAHLLPCPSLKRCKFDEAAWHASLDPMKDLRDERAKEWEQQYGARQSAGDDDDADDYVPARPETHAEYVERHLAATGLPPGYTAMDYKNYILRPEAVESVWYMYRITGDATWMEKGWAMFEATVAATETELAYSAIEDVTSAGGTVWKDEMESFWLAETLKYYLLLFSEPEVVSLDEWVLNTEAHPFRRPRVEDL